MSFLPSSLVSAVRSSFTTTQPAVDVTDGAAAPMDPAGAGNAAPMDNWTIIATPVDTAAAAPSGACTLTSTIEKPAVAHGEAQSLLAMASLVAPPAPPNAARPPIDLIPCVDRSGSMGGEKIKLVKQMLKLLITKTGLTATDRLGLVSFDHDVKEELPLVAMDTQGRARAEAVAGALAVGGTTNLSGGLLKSLDMINQSAASAAAGRTRCVLLFTDGQANQGIRDTPGLVSAVQGAVGGTQTTLFTFGFGEDHNEDMLRTVAETAGGLYYFIAGLEDIPTAFADCLGGIMSVVAQNATLTLEPAVAPTGEAAARVGKVFGSYKVSGAAAEPAAAAAAAPVAAAPGAPTSIAIGDLYAEDEKDLLFELQLPALPAPSDAQPVVKATLRYFSVANSKIEEVAAELAVCRPSETPADQPVDQRLDEQRNRMRAADAMEEAARLGDAGDLDAARALLAATREVVINSPSAATPLCAALVRECDSLSGAYVDQRTYTSCGSKASKMQSYSHKMQRGTHMSADVYRAGSRAKSGMKSSWGLQ